MTPDRVRLAIEIAGLLTVLVLGPGAVLLFGWVLRDLVRFFRSDRDRP